MRLRSRLNLTLVSLALVLPSFAFAKPDAPIVGAVGLLEGPATYQAKGAGDFTPLKAGQPVAAADVIKTEANGKVTLAFSDGSKVQIGPSANVAIESLEPKKMSFKVALGVFDAWVAKLKKRRFQVKTPTAVASVRGTELRAAVDAAGNSDFFCFGGSIEVGGSTGRAVDISAGQTVSADKGTPVSKPEAIPETVTQGPPPDVQIPSAEPAPAPAPSKAPAPDESKPAPSEAPKEGDGTTSEVPPPPPPSPSQDQNVAPVSGSTP
ncbi:MAG: FecR domain-containing protein [Elusimicrobia bacterium]|nr:FecR domain-containing protein [Elusimicrobiota bacterium]